MQAKIQWRRPKMNTLHHGQPPTNTRPHLVDPLAHAIGGAAPGRVLHHRDHGLVADVQTREAARREDHAGSVRRVTTATELWLFAKELVMADVPEERDDVMIKSFKSSSEG
jgi:hypothetical protein